MGHDKISDKNLPDIPFEGPHPPPTPAPAPAETSKYRGRAVVYPPKSELTKELEEKLKSREKPLPGPPNRTPPPIPTISTTAPPTRSPLPTPTVKGEQVKLPPFPKETLSSPPSSTRLPPKTTPLPPPLGQKRLPAQPSTPLAHTAPLRLSPEQKKSTLLTTTQQIVSITDENVTPEQRKTVGEIVRSLRDEKILNESELIQATASHFRSNKQQFDPKKLDPKERTKYKETEAILKKLKISDPNILQESKKIGQHMHNQTANIQLEDLTPLNVNPPPGSPINSFTNVAQLQARLENRIVSDILASTKKEEAAKKFGNYMKIAAALASDGELTTAMAVFGALNNPNVQTLFYPQGTEDKEKQLLNHLPNDVKKIYKGFQKLRSTSFNQAEFRRATELLHTTQPLAFSSKDITATNENQNLAIRYNIMAKIVADAIPQNKISGNEMSDKEYAKYFGTNEEYKTAFGDTAKIFESPDARNMELRETWYKKKS